MSEFERQPGESDLQHAARLNQVKLTSPERDAALAEWHQSRFNRLNDAAFKKTTVDGELGPQPVSRPTVLHIVADTMKIRQAAFEMCNTIYTRKGVHPEHKIRLEAKDLTALLSAAIHKYLHDNDVNI
jgi:hypothetical protein